MNDADRYVPAAGRRGLNAVYDPVLALTTRESTFRAAVVAAVIAAQPGDVLDVGAGTGTLAAMLAQASPEVSVVGVDGDAAILARARRKARTFGARVRFIEGRADALPAEDASVDVVVASLLLHHLATDAKRRALDEMRRVLRPGGRLVVADWGRAHDPLMRGAFFVLQLIDGFAPTRDHAAGRLPDLIARAGFQAVAVGPRWRTLWGSLELIVATV